MKKILITVACLFVIGAPACSLGASSALGELRVAPTEIKIKSQPGNSISGEIFLENTSGEVIQVRCYVRDIVSTLSGVTYGEIEGNKESIIDWVELGKEEISVTPNKGIRLPYTVNIPYGTRAGSYWGVVFFELYGSGNQESVSDVNIHGRIGVKTFVEVDRLKKSEITEIKTTKLGIFKDGYKTTFLVRNLGSISFNAKGFVSVSIPENDIPENQYFFDKGSLVPGEEKLISIEYKTDENFKKYEGLIRLSDFEARTEMYEFYAVPLVTIVQSVFIILLFVIPTFLYKKRKRKIKIKK